MPVERLVASSSRVRSRSTSAESTNDQRRIERFEQLVLAHLDAAYTLARYLTGNVADAEDAVQESSFRAWRSFDGFRDGDARVWLLTIVRNTCYTHLARNRTGNLSTEFDDEIHSTLVERDDRDAAERRDDARATLADALEHLPREFREALVLRELEGLSYREIGVITGVPAGTVMSRLSRARARLERVLLQERGGGEPR